MLNKINNDDRHYLLFVFAIIISGLLSYSISFNQYLINPDAICYLSSAQIIGTAGLNEASQLCGQAKWPFYPLLIHSLVTFSHVTYPMAAHLIDACFSIISVVTFILIVKELGGSKRILWLAAAVILMSHEFNNIRQYIVRDHGFWAFYLISFLCLLRFYQYPTFSRALAWSVSLLIATLFRIEGALFLLALPFFTWLVSDYHPRQKLKAFLLLNTFTIIAIIPLSVWMIKHPEQTLGRISEIPQQIQHGLFYISDKYHDVKLALIDHVLTSDSVREAGLIVFLVLIVWYLLCIVTNLSWIYTALLIYSVRSKAFALTAYSLPVIIGYIAINLLVTAGFLAEHMFLSKRYLIALSLILMLAVPFAIEKLIQTLDTFRSRLILCVTIILMLCSSTGGIFEFGYSKAYIRDAGDWLAKNVPMNASIYINDYQLMYFSQHFGNRIFQLPDTYWKGETIANDKWKQFEYIALRLNKNERSDFVDIFHQINYIPVNAFHNKRGDLIMILKKPSEK